MADLDTKRIAAAALAVADERGAGGFTMRAVAEALDVTPMALYYHVADKTALVGLVVDLAMREVPLPDPTDDWRNDLWEMARWMREIAGAHPAVTQLRRRYPVWTADVLPVTERWFSVWHESGLDHATAIRAASVSSMAITGLAAEGARFEEMELPAEAQLVPHPNASEAFRREYDGDAEFELLVRSLIDGLYARLVALSS
ncbi:MAG: TetR/AcrR family transcriptional regulator C-terminal domain-containing protein [Ilumatobacteraceae bacterium]